MIITITARRTYLVGRSPAAVNISGRFVVALSDVSVSPGGRDAAGEQSEHDREKQYERPWSQNSFHFPTALLSLSDHSSSPNGAPDGSAMTATISP